MYVCSLATRLVALAVAAAAAAAAAAAVVVLAMATIAAAQTLSNHRHALLQGLLVFSVSFASPQSTSLPT
jgi:hypothetical protein